MAGSPLGPRISNMWRRLIGSPARAFDKSNSHATHWNTRRKMLHVETLETKVLLAGDLGVQDDTQNVDNTSKAVDLSSLVIPVAQKSSSTDDHGDNAASSTAIDVPSTTAGNIEPARDTDWFRINTIAGATYEISTVIGTVRDTTLTLIAPDGNTVVAFDDDGGPGFASSIQWTAPTSNTYYVQVGAFNVRTGTYELEVSSDTVITGSLALAISPSSIAENGAAAQGTVALSSGLFGPVTVSLSSSDTTEAVVPAQVTIPSGASSTTFAVSPVDDGFVDGAQTVIISASATDLISAMDSLNVRDNEGDDHGNNATTATAIGVPTLTQGVIETAGDTDWFQFDAIAGVTYEFETSAGTVRDTTLTLFAPDGTTTLAFDDDSGDDLTSFIEWTATSSDMYFVQVAAFAVRTGSYELSVSSDTTVSGSLSVSIDPSSITENGVAQGTVSLSSGFAGPLTVSLSSSDTSEAIVPGTVVISSGQNSANFAVNAVDDNLDDGSQTVVIAASAAGFASGADTLVVLDNEGDDHGNDAVTATSIGVPSVTQGTIETAGDTDWFRFDASAGSMYELVTMVGSLRDTTLTLIAPDGTTALLFDDDGGADLASRIEWTAPTSDTYFLQVAGFNLRTGNYSLSVTTAQLPVPGDEIILDSENEVGVKLIGNWTESTGADGFLGENYYHDGNTRKGDKRAVFTANLEARVYEVFIRWTSDPNRASNVPVSVSHKGGTTNVTVNQQRDGGDWVSLGVFDFNAGVQDAISLGTAGTDGYVIVDAARFVADGSDPSPPPTPPTPEVILDSEISVGVELSGNWVESTGADGFLGDSYFHDGNTGNGKSVATFTAQLPETGSYEVFLRWASDPNRATNTRMNISHQNGNTAFKINQQENGGQWVSFGTYEYSTFVPAIVTIDNINADGYVIVDAVRFVLAGT